MAKTDAADPDLRPAFFGVGVVGGFLGAIIIAFAALIWSIDGNFVDWPQSPQDNSANQAVVGADIASTIGCLGCHSIDGAEKTGPTWLGIAGTSRELRSGGSEIANSGYLRTAIVDPQAHVVAGYQAALMPTNYGESLSNSEISAIVAYIESLAAEG